MERITANGLSIVSRDKLIYGPEQIHARLNQDPAIVELTLINQQRQPCRLGQPARHPD
jgi:uncharacterized membrane protein (UPF0182 family)